MLPIEGVSLDEIEVCLQPVVRLLPRRLDRTLGALLLPRQISVLHGAERAPLSIIAHGVTVSSLRQKKDARVVFLDSGSNYKPRTIRNLCKMMGISGDDIKRIVVGKVLDLYNLERMVAQVKGMHDVTVVILDNLTSTLNKSFPPGSKGRQRQLFQTLEDFRDLVNEIGCHLLITDHSSVDWNSGARTPVGGNVLAHAVDTLVSVTVIDSHEHLVSLLVEQTPVTPMPAGCVLVVTVDGIRTIKGA